MINPFRKIFLKLEKRIETFGGLNRKEAAMQCPRCDKYLRAQCFWGHITNSYCELHEVRDEPDLNYRVEFYRVPVFMNLADYINENKDTHLID